MIETIKSQDKTVGFLQEKKLAKNNGFVYFSVGRDYSVAKSATTPVGKTLGVIIKQIEMKRIILIVLVAVGLSACDEENLPKDISTTVHGVLSDPLGLPIVNASVRVAEYNKRFVSDGGAQDEFVGFVGSTVTNASGEYQLTFTTTGNGDTYKLILENSPQDQSYIGYYDPVEIENIGGDFNFSYNSFFLLYPCQITIQPDVLEHFPIFIYHETTRSSPNPEITSNETFLKTIYISHYSEQTVQFSRVKTDGTAQIAVFTFGASNSQNPTMQNIVLAERNFIDN